MGSGVGLAAMLSGREPWWSADFQSALGVGGAAVQNAAGAGELPPRGRLADLDPLLVRVDDPGELRAAAETRL